MKTSDAGLQLIKDFEQCRLAAYQCSAGVWTIGWGHTKGVKQGDTCTQAQADAWLAEDVAEVEQGVRLLVKVPLTQGQFDALVSFAFNCGLDIDVDTIAEGLGDSTLLRKLNAGDYIGAALEFQKWDKSSGMTLRGLTRRRLAERALFEYRN